MANTELIRAKETSFGRDVLATIRYHLGGRPGLLALAAAVIVAGLAFNWSWLVAAGVAPLLLGVLPCVVMCALGLCMHRMTGRPCPAENASLRSGEATDEPPTEAANPKGQD